MHLLSGFSYIWKCSKFKDLSVEERHNIANENDLCFNCLVQDHRAVNCRSKLSCRKCGKRPNTLLHFKSKQNSKCVLALKESVTDEETCSNNPIDFAKNVSVATSFSKFPGRSKILFQGRASMQTYAFINEGSNVNICSETLVKKLGVPVSGSNIELITSNATSLIESKVDGLGIQGIDEPAAFFVKMLLWLKS